MKRVPMMPVRDMVIFPQQMTPFIVGREGKIVYKLVGPITPDNLDSVVRAEIDKAMKAGS